MSFSLSVAPRLEQGKKNEVLRRQGFVPAILYGPKEKSPTLLKVEKSALEKIVKHAGETNVITLTGLDVPKDVLIHDVSYNPARGGIIHVDFYAVDAETKITVDVPLEFVGEAPATKLGGVVTKVLHEVTLTCLPKDIPAHLTIDISILDVLDKQIHIADIPVPSSVTVENKPDEVVALVQAVAEEVESGDGVDMSAIEVEKKGKTETEAS